MRFGFPPETVFGMRLETRSFVLPQIPSPQDARYDRLAVQRVGVCWLGGGTAERLAYLGMVVRILE
jgi:hypothetical protein